MSEAQVKALIRAELLQRLDEVGIQGKEAEMMADYGMSDPEIARRMLFPWG